MSYMAARGLYTLPGGSIRHLRLVNVPVTVRSRSLHATKSLTLAKTTSTSPSQLPVEGSTDISHSSFISSASPSSDFNPLQTPSAGTTAATPWQGYLSPTNSHLLKLILPLPASKSNFEWNTDPSKSGTNPQPTAFLLHPSQPLSHLSRLIAGSLPVKFRDCELEYLALTGQEDDLDSHLRNAEEEKLGKGEAKESRQEGGPHLGERKKSRGRFQEVSWSQATDLSDFVKQSCLNEKFKIVITPRTIGGEVVKEESEGGKKMGMALEVIIPSFASRTTYLRKRLLELTKKLDEMTRKKKSIDTTAHKGAQRLFVAGLSVGAAYWVAVMRWTFFTDAGWDVMEPVTWATGFGALLASCSFLVYHNREVSYSSLLDLSISARQRRLYDQHGLNIEWWTEAVAEAKTLRKEISRIAADYDIEWKGDLENLAGDLDEGVDSKPLEERLKDGDGDHVRKSDKSHRESKSASASDSESEGESSTSSPSSTSTSSSASASASELSSYSGSSSSDNKDGNKNGSGKDKHLDIDATIDEASALAAETDAQKSKEQAAQRKGEEVEQEDGRGEGSKERSEREKEGMRRGRNVVEKNQERFE